MAESSKAFRIVQVSDTHLSRQRAYFHDNWEVFVAEMQAAPPDLIVASGDLSFDGAGADEDLAFAKSEYDRLPCPWIAIPGNHDIGESHLQVRHDQPVDAARMARWRGIIGPQWWVRDIAAWRLVGIDSALFGSDCSEAEEQWAFLGEALGGRGGRPVLLFVHIPPFLIEPDNAKFTALAVPHAVRFRLLEASVAGGVTVMACGHVHVARSTEWKGLPIEWAPATSFFNIVERQKAGLGIPRPGYVEWTLNGTAYQRRLVEPPLMITYDIGLWNAAHGSTTKMPPRPLKR